MNLSGKRMILLPVIVAVGAFGGEALQRGVHPEDLITDQRDVQSRLENLELRLKKMAQRLEKVSAEDAEKTRTVEGELRNRNVVSDLGTVVDALKESKYTAAVKRQEEVINDLKEILRFLEGRKYGTKDWESQLEKVRAVGKKIRDLLGNQRTLRQESEQGVAAQGEARSIGELVSEIGKVLSRQQGLAEKLPETSLPAERLIEALADDVAALSREQGRLRGDVSRTPSDRELEALHQKAETVGAQLKAGEEGGALASKVEALADAVSETLGNKSLADALRESARSGLESPADRQRAAGDVRLAGEKSEKGAPLAALVPTQAELEYGSREIERKLGELGPETAEGNERSFQEASEALNRASGQMERASRGLQTGQRQEALASQEGAQQALQKAEAALRGLSRALKGRDKYQRAAAVQKALAKETEAVREQTNRLRKKLRPRQAEGQRFDSAERALGQAQKAMQQAAAAFGQRQTRGMQRAGEAAQHLAAAQKALKEEGLKRLRRHDLESLASRQDEVRKEAENLARELGQGAEAALRRAGNRVGRAGGQMGRASKSFKSGQAGEGAKAQDRAIEELTKAEQDLTREEHDLERLRQEQELTDMLGLLVTGRDRQREIVREITACEEARDARGRLPRSKRMLAQKLAREERKIITDVGQVRDRLAREKAQVWAFVADDIIGDMEQVREALAGEDTGPFTQLLARETVEKMDELLQSLKEQRSQRRQQQQQGMAQTRLIPPVAEAKMLKKMQQDINARTEALDRAKTANDGELNETMVRQLTRLALRQGSLATLTKKVARDLFKLVTEEAEGGDEGEADGNDKQ